MSLLAWSYLFLVVYIGAMLAIGVVGQRRVNHADDFAAARGAYGPLFLAFAGASRETLMPSRPTRTLLVPWTASR